jgi:hypothetical protein
VTGADVSAALVGLLLLVAIAILVVLVRRRGAASGIDVGRPDTVTTDVVTGLMAELRGARAETDYWKDQAERFRGQLEEGGSSPPPQTPTQLP